MLFEDSRRYHNHLDLHHHNYKYLLNSKIKKNYDKNTKQSY